MRAHARSSPLWLLGAAHGAARPRAAVAAQRQLPASTRSLDADKHTRRPGKERLTWRTSPAAPPTTLVFHLYMNAFKNEALDLLQGVARAPPRRARPRSTAGAPSTSRKLVVGGVDLTKQLRGRRHARHASRSTQPSRPAPTSTSTSTSRPRCPRCSRAPATRTTSSRSAQWFPKIGVFDCEPDGTAAGARTSTT